MFEAKMSENSWAVGIKKPNKMPKYTVLFLWY
jgi:hypothetical protein